MAELDDEIVRAAEEIRRIAGEQFKVKVYASDLPDPGSVTPTEYARKAHIAALAQRMVEIKQQEQREAEEKAAGTAEKTRAEEPEEGLSGKVMSAEEIRQVYEQEEAAFERKIEGRQKALDPSLGGKVMTPGECYEAMKAQEKAKEEVK